MRKTFAGALAGLMILCMGTTVFAAPSADAGSVEYQAVTNSILELPQAGNIKVEKVSEEVYEEAVSKTTGAVVSMADVKLKNVSGVNISKGVPVSLAVSTLMIDDDVDTIRILHKRSSDGQWEIIKPSEVNTATGEISYTLYDFSPIAVVRYEKGKAPNSTQYIPTQPTNNSNGTTGGYVGNWTYTGGSGSTTKPNDTVKPGDTENPGNTDNPGNTGDDGSTMTPGDPDDGVQDPDDGLNDPDDDYGDDEALTDGDKPSKKEPKKQQAVKTQTVVRTVHVSRKSTAATSPKTGSSLPALPIIAMFSLMGIAYCGKKAKSL